MGNKSQILVNLTNELNWVGNQAHNNFLIGYIFLSTLFQNKDPASLIPKLQKCAKIDQSASFPSIFQSGVGQFPSQKGMDLERLMTTSSPPQRKTTCYNVEQIAVQQNKTRQLTKQKPTNEILGLLSRATETVRANGNINFAKPRMNSNHCF